MPKEFGVSFLDPESQQQITIRGEFTDSEWRTLTAYASYVEDLEATELLQDRSRVRIELVWDREAGLIDNSVLAQRSATAEFIHCIRPIILQSEPTFFLTVRGILAKKLNHPYLRQLLHRLREQFLADPAHAGWTLSLGELTLNSEEALNVWLNGFEYHRDQEKRDRMERLHGGPVSNASIAMFLTMLVHKADAAIVVAGLVRTLEKGGGAKFSVQFG